MKDAQKEFLELLTNYQGIIHKINLVYFRSQADKQDNFQEIVYQLWRSFPTLQNKERPASWIYSVAINTSISKVRQERRFVTTDTLPEMPITSDTDYADNTDYTRLMDALHRLGEVDRSIMLLYLEDLSYDEIAGIMGISPSNVGVKIHRLKNQLQKTLK